jgi:hypothetical protein
MGFSLLTFSTVETKHPFLEHSVFTVPQTKRQTHALMVVPSD